MNEFNFQEQFADITQLLRGFIRFPLFRRNHNSFSNTMTISYYSEKKQNLEIGGFVHDRAPIR